MKTPLDGELSNAELCEYLAFVSSYTQTARDTSRAFEDLTKDSKAENKRLEEWIDTGKRSKVAYLLSMVDESNYVTTDPEDRHIVDDLRKQKRMELASRRGEKRKMVK
eukprot:TRINITY_DN4320_c0_g1_i1.p1 TRINITY_DN4320_c0_g1~~TRINITY_DN4320_c0_g1_i1.p1  ORF type:complete len:108 (+),score=28.72 TRINITY_DN4320_c0_g1_i1:67-390(+)